ncbi:MAG: NPCBM/NEW2 domain-containing protein [Lentisphaeria bacterium]|nr:NPCBM/NEW2 domain-containing protein [Lentisphaeria bacterium]
MINKLIPLLILAAFTLSAQQEDIIVPETYYLVDNFSSRMSGSTAQLTAEIDEKIKKVGVASNRLTYDFGNKRFGLIKLREGEIRSEKQGELKFWLFGDGSGNTLSLSFKHSAKATNKIRGKHLAGHRPYKANKFRIPLTFKGWKEIIVDFTDEKVSRRVIWLESIRVDLKAKGKTKKGQIWIDDMRVYPERRGAAPLILADLSLNGPKMRSYDDNIYYNLDVRNFSDDSAKIITRLKMSDSNDNQIADRSFDIKVEANASKEIKLNIEPENLQIYLPPFKITAELFSPDSPDVSSHEEQDLIMGNAMFLHDNFSDVAGRWFLSGIPFELRRGPDRVSSLFTESQRSNAQTQTSGRISRVKLDAAAMKKIPGQYAMNLKFVKDAMVFNGLPSAASKESERYLPGDAYSMGLWVKGSGGGSLHAIIIDFAAPGATSYNWKLHYQRIKLCDLNFTGWKYIEVPLPGNGIGTHRIRGSTEGIDYPLELTAFVVKSAFKTETKMKEVTDPKDKKKKIKVPYVVKTKEPAGGEVSIAGLTVHTQSKQAKALALHIGYDDATNNYQAKSGAWVTVQNSWRVKKRTMSLDWELTDRNDDIIVKGRQKLDLLPLAHKSIRIELAKHAKKIAGKSAPFHLRVVATDAEDEGRIERTIVLARPDSNVMFNDFETVRGYLGLKAAGVDKAPQPGQEIAKTSTVQKKSGKQSLAMNWTKGPSIFVSIDPPVPGIPTEVSMQVYGDGSGVLFYPLIGDQHGVLTGREDLAWDLFLPISLQGPLQNAVKVDWKGWKLVKFRLPVIPHNWSNEDANKSFQPTYPLGLHLAVTTKTTEVAKGTIYVDDIVFKSHIDPAKRVSMVLNRSSATNLVKPGTDITVTVANMESGGKSRKVIVSGGLFDWRGTRVTGSDTTLNLGPGKSKLIAVCPKIKEGAYILKISLKVVIPAKGKLKEVAKQVAYIKEDVLVADGAKVMNANWLNDAKDQDRLRIPLKATFAPINQDWDWTEFHIGNLQVETLMEFAYGIKRNKQEPFGLLGYSAFWASGTGFEDMENDVLMIRGGYDTGGRDWGHTVDIFHTPVRIDDWDNYCFELMRKTGKHMSGWILWDSPDSSAGMGLGVDPALFAKMIRIADKWRVKYCPETPIYIGGLSKATSVSYLLDLSEQYDDHLAIAAAQKAVDKIEKDMKKKAGDDEPKPADLKVLEAAKKKVADLIAKSLTALDHIQGVNLRIDAGTLSPEDSRIMAYISEVRSVIEKRSKNKAPKAVLVTDLDWGVERGEGGLNAFDQTAYLIRANLLMHQQNVQQSLIMSNDRFLRTGYGMIYKRTTSIPPMSQRMPTFQFKPVWWGLARTRKLLAGLNATGEVVIQDRIPGLTRCLTYIRKSDKKKIAIIWRNNDPAVLNFEKTGLSVVSAVDIFGAAVIKDNKQYVIGMLPCIFEMKAGAEPLQEALTRLRVQDKGMKLHWAQAVVASFTPATGKIVAWKGPGTAKEFEGYDSAGSHKKIKGIAFKKGDTESFTCKTSGKYGLVLRKRFYLDANGQQAEVKVNGKSIGTWDMSTGFTITKIETDKLSHGFRESSFLLPVSGSSAKIELTYTTDANTIGWTVLEQVSGPFELGLLGAVHVDSVVISPRIAKNVVGLGMQFGQEKVDHGISMFAPALMEYSLNKQFKTLKASYGIDAVTEGKGSIVFEIWLDQKKVWNSKVISGLDKVQKLEVDVTGGKRLRLIITDGGDGNKFDVGNWGNIEIK